MYATLGETQLAAEDYDNAMLCSNYLEDVINNRHLAFHGGLKKGIARAMRVLDSMIGDFEQENQYDLYFSGVRCLLTSEVKSAERFFKAARMLPGAFKEKSSRHLDNIESLRWGA